MGPHQADSGTKERHVSTSRPISPQRVIQPAPLEALLASMAQTGQTTAMHPAAQGVTRTHRRSHSCSRPNRPDAPPGGPQQSTQGTGDVPAHVEDAIEYLDPIVTALRCTELASMYSLDLTTLRNKLHAERAHKEYVPW